MRFEIDPIRGLADEVPSVRVIDGPAEGEVRLNVACVDAKNHSWESQNIFRTDTAGTIDLSRDALVSGSYGSVDSAGPLWSMGFASKNIAPSVFAAP